MADGNIAFNASLNTGGFKSGAAELQSIAGKMSSAVGSQFTALAGKVVAIGAAFVGVHQAASAFREALNMGGQLDDLSKTTGASAGELLLLQKAFELAGSSADAVGPAIARLSRFMVEAGAGGAAQIETMNKLGLSYDQLKGRTPTEQMRLLAQSIMALPTPADRTAAAMDIFGKSGSTLIPLFANISGELDKAQGYLGSLPGLLDESAGAMADMEDDIGALGDKFNQFAAGLVAGAAGADNFASALAKIDTAGIGAGLGEQLRNAFAAPLETAKAIGYTLLTGVKQAGNNLMNAFSTAVSFFQNLFSDGEYWSGIGQRVQAMFMESVNAFNKLLLDAVEGALLQPLSNLPGILGDPFRAALETTHDIRASLESASEANAKNLAEGGAKIEAAIERAAANTETITKDWFGVEQSAADAARHIMAAQEKGSVKIAEDMSSARVDSERIAKALQDAKQNPLSPLFDKFGESAKPKPFKLQPDLTGSENFPTSGGPGAPSPAPTSGGGGGSRMAPPAPKTAKDYETEMRAAAAAARHSGRARDLQEGGFYGAAGRAMERADKAAQNVRDRADISKFLRDQYDAGNMGEAYEKYRRQTGMDRDSREEFEKRTREKALTDSERQAKDEERGGGGERPAAGANPMAEIITFLKTTFDDFKERVPQNALS
jgi:hypothetical protein